MRSRHNSFWENRIADLVEILDQHLWFEWLNFPYHEVVTLLKTDISHRKILLSRWFSFSLGRICDRFLEGMYLGVYLDVSQVKRVISEIYRFLGARVPLKMNLHFPLVNSLLNLGHLMVNICKCSQSHHRWCGTQKFKTVWWFGWFIYYECVFLGSLDTLWRKNSKFSYILYCIVLEASYSEWNDPVTSEPPAKTHILQDSRAKSTFHWWKWTQPPQHCRVIWTFRNLPVVLAAG